MEDAPLFRSSREFVELQEVAKEFAQLDPEVDEIGSKLVEITELTYKLQTNRQIVEASTVWILEPGQTEYRQHDVGSTGVVDKIEVEIEASQVYICWHNGQVKWRALVTDHTRVRRFSLDSWKIRRIAS